MGLFDYVHCEIPLPEGQELVYQSKDLDDEMKGWTIRADGILVKHEYDREQTPDNELPHKDEPEDSLLRLMGCMRAKAGSERDEERQRYDGDLHFYTEHLDYRATFRRGRVVELCQFKSGHDSQWEHVWPNVAGGAEGGVDAD